MHSPALVLVHGGQHSADCWDLTVDELRRRAPHLPVLAVDMPGHGTTSGDLTTVSIAACVRSAVEQIEDAGLGDVIVVGHSLAGLTLPGMVTKLGSPRVREMVLAACCLPVQGKAIVDTLVGPLAWYVRRAVRLRRPPATMPNMLSALIFCNGMTREQRRFTLSRIHPEAVTIIAEPVDRSDLPDDVPRTWILTLRDHALFRRIQLRSIAALGGVQTLIPVDTCHDLMISEPALLAEILIDRCRLRSAERLVPASEITCVTLVSPVQNLSDLVGYYSNMRSSSREEIVEVLDALEAGYKRALDLTFDVLTTPERLAVLERCEQMRRWHPAIEHPLINQLAEQADPTELGGKLAPALANRLRISRAEASRRIHEAADLGERRALERRTAGAGACPLPPRRSATATSAPVTSR